MQLHGNARTTPYLRREMVRRVLEQAKPVKDTAAALSVSERTVFKWLRRYRQEGAHQQPDQARVRPSVVPGAGDDQPHRHAGALEHGRDLQGDGVGGGG